MSSTPARWGASGLPALLTRMWQGLRFRDLFQWLSNSQRSLSHSNPGEEDKVPFSNPAAPGGWASL